MKQEIEDMVQENEDRHKIRIHGLVFVLVLFAIGCCILWFLTWVSKEWLDSTNPTFKDRVGFAMASLIPILFLSAIGASLIGRWGLKYFKIDDGDE